MADDGVAAVIVATAANRPSPHALRAFQKRNGAAARHLELFGVAVPSGLKWVIGLQGAGEDIARFAATMAKDQSPLTHDVLVQRPVEGRLFARRGLIAPWIRPGEAAWLEAAMRRDPRDGEALLAFLSWTALRQAEADLGLYAATLRAEAWSPFDFAETDPPEPGPETESLSPTYS